MRCKKCGLTAPVRDLDENGLCYNCTDDLSFKSNKQIISHQEVKKRKKENTFFESLENNSQNLNPIPIFIFTILCCTMYFYYDYSDTIPKTEFLSTFLSLSFHLLLLGIISVIIYCFGTEIIKPVLLSLLKRTNSLKQAIILVTILIITLLLVCPLIITFKAII